MLPKFSLLFLEIYTYPLLMGIAWGAAARMFFSLNEKTKCSLKFPKIFLIGSFLSSWIGAKLLYLWTADFAAKGSIAGNPDFWMGGGFVFYGGLIFGLLFTFAFALWTKQKLARFNSLLAPLALGHGIGRIGCFFAGCCYGLETNSPAGVFMGGSHRYPTQLFEALALFSLAYVFSRERALSSKNSLWNYMMIYGLFRFLIEFLRGDAIRGFHWWGISTSQIFAAAFLAISLVVIFGQKLVENRTAL